MKRSSRSDADDSYRRSLDVIKVMREQGGRYSLTHAARESGTSSATVKRYAKSALRASGGRYQAKPADRLRRDLIFYDAKGQITLVTHSSRQASEVARFHNAVRSWVIYGDDSALREFDGKSIVVDGVVYPYLTDRRTLLRLARAGELDILDIYRK